MKLLIDVGNTRLKLATLAGDNMTFVSAIAIDVEQIWQAELQAAIAAIDGNPTTCIAASVANPSVERAIETAIETAIEPAIKTPHGENWPTPVVWASSQISAAGVTNAYPDPTQLGTARWVAMIGLTRHFAKPHPPIVLASFGTATTIDTLSPDNEFKGGLILPGVSLMHQALANGTARLPNATGDVAAFPTNTASAITSGIVASQAGAVIRQVKAVRQAYGQEPVVCAAGGAWPAVQAELSNLLAPRNILELPHIVLDGLAVLANANKDRL